jgi:hypothetical protein
MMLIVVALPFIILVGVNGFYRERWRATFGLAEPGEGEGLSELCDRIAPLDRGD